jgi:hypothetical protein
MPKGELRLGERGPQVGHPVAIGVAKQRDPVCAWCGGASALHGRAHEDLLQAEALVVFGRSIAFGHQNVTVGKDAQPARMVKIRRKGVDLQSFGSEWMFSAPPPGRIGDVDRRDHGWAWFWQNRIRTVSNLAGVARCLPG